MENSNTLIAGENKPQAKYNKNVSIIPMFRPILGSETNPIDDRQQQSSKSSQQSYSCNHDSSSQSICCPHQILFNAFSKFTSAILLLILSVNCLPFNPARWPKKVRFSFADNDS